MGMLRIARYQAKKTKQGGMSTKKPTNIELPELSDFEEKYGGVILGTIIGVFVLAFVAALIFS